MTSVLLKRAAVATAAAAILGGTFVAGRATAAPDARLDNADAKIEQAIVLLQAAENEGVKPPFGGHRAAAVVKLKSARKSIERAKKYVEKREEWKKKKEERRKKREERRKNR